LAAHPWERATDNMAANAKAKGLEVMPRERPGRPRCDQLRSIDESRLGKRIGRLLKSDLDAVDEALRTTLDLGGG